MSSCFSAPEQTPYPLGCCEKGLTTSVGILLSKNGKKYSLLKQTTRDHHVCQAEVSLGIQQMLVWFGLYRSLIGSKY